MQEEGLTLLVADNGTGYYGVTLLKPGQPKPYEARVRRGGKQASLGCFATAEEAALFAVTAPPLTSEEALQQAQAEGLVLRVAENWTGYFGVTVNNPGTPKPYKAQVKRGGKVVHLGTFATAEEAALRVARSPEGRGAAAQQEASPLTNEEEGQGRSPTVPPSAIKEEGVVPPMPPDAFELIVEL